MLVFDPEARHGRKTPSQRRDGYKAHVAAEPETGVITACEITAANTADAETGLNVLEGEHTKVEVIAHSAYGSSEIRAALKRAGHITTAKPIPQRRRSALRGIVRCAATAAAVASGTASNQQPSKDP